MEPKHQKLVDLLCNKRKCKRSSARVYASNLHRLHREFGTGKWDQGLNWLKPKVLLPKILKMQNSNTRRNMLSSVLVAMHVKKLEPTKPYTDAIGKLNVEQKKQRASGELTAKQAEKFISWKDVLKLRRLLTRTVRLARYYARSKVSRSEFQVMQQNLVLWLYTEIPPVRNDWSELQWVSQKEWDQMGAAQKQSTNNLVMSRPGWRVYWANYKTRDKHGVIMQKIPTKLATVLRRHVKFLKEHYPEQRSLLLSAVGTPMSRNGLTKFMQKLFFKHFRKKISTSALRSIFVSHRFSKSELEEQAEVAHAMHHTPAVQREFYAKNVPSKENE